MILLILLNYSILLLWLVLLLYGRMYLCIEFTIVQPTKLVRVIIDYR